MFVCCPCSHRLSFFKYFVCLFIFVKHTRSAYYNNNPWVVQRVARRNGALQPLLLANEDVGWRRERRQAGQSRQATTSTFDLI